MKFLSTVIVVSDMVKSIGYSVEENYRGHNYAAKACMLVKLIASSCGTR